MNDIKIYKFYPEFTEEQKNPTFMKFADLIGNEVNKDTELIEAAKITNLDFAKKLQQLINNKEYAEFCGNRLMVLMDRFTRFHVMSGFEFEGKTYDLIVDLLTWSFKLKEKEEA